MIPAWVNDYVGLPFKVMGRDRSGLGCWGLVYLVYREQFGLEVPAYAENYFTVNDGYEVGKLIAGEIVTKWVPVERGSEMLGDAILMRMAGFPSHIGIVIEPSEKKFLHVHAGGGGTSGIARYDSIQWAHRVTGFYRYAG